MSTTTPGGSEGSGSAVPASDRPHAGSASAASPRSAVSPRSAGSAATAPAGEEEREDTAASTTSAVRRSLAERFAASAAGARVGAAAASVGGTRTGPARPAPRAASPADPRAETTRSDAPARETGEGSPRPVAGPRRVRLSLSRVDPWSVMKLAFLMSIAIGIGIVVATAVVWFVLDSMHVFADIEELLVSIGSDDLLQLMAFVEFDRVISMATIIAVVDVLLLTALCTIGAFVYNLVAALVGGLHLTLTDD